MKAAIYGRVSTVDKQDVSTQMDALRDYAKGKGYDEVVEFVDVGVSGAKDKRPALDKLIEGVKNKDFCAVICYKMDRLARSLKNLMFLLNLFTENDVAFISLSENIDLSTSIGKLMVHVLGSFSQFERDLIIERVKFALYHAKANGVVLGRRKQYEDKEQCIIDSYQDGLNYREISQKFGVSRGTVFNVLKLYRQNLSRIPL